MNLSIIPCNYVFSTSWEVCNKVGGIYTVLSTQAKSLQQDFKDHLIYIGPYLGQNDKNSPFQEDYTLLPLWRKVAQDSGLDIHIGRWNIPGLPICILMNFEILKNRKNEIYSHMWEDFKVDSLHAYGDYDDACLFSLTAGMLVTAIYKSLLQGKKVIYQAHEWMSGMGMLYVKSHCPEIATVFTTHATSIGRSIVSNGKPFYQYFYQYQGDQMAIELNMQSKHSIEKQAALNADCMTTVSKVTDKECGQLLQRKSDVILPNGFDKSFVPTSTLFNAKRKKSRKIMLQVAGALLGKKLSENTLIISTSGRNDFRCKGFDLLIKALTQLQKIPLDKDILAVISVPCWKKAPRKDLLERMEKGILNKPLIDPFITHTLFNTESDQILCALKAYGMKYDAAEKLHILFIPSYLDGNDGIINLNYYDWLTGCDFCIYPSYYEPWGYTPLESMAFGIPCLTTDLAGIGQWICNELGHEATLNDGVVVIQRSDDNYDEASINIVRTIEQFTTLSKEERKIMSKKCKTLAIKANWKLFIKNYYKAFAFALSQKKK